MGIIGGNVIDFVSFPKIPRYNRDCIVTEKIDGANGQICITEDGNVLVGGRNRWLSTEADDRGFAAWASEHKEELLTFGPGRHMGEWWGCKINRGYGLKEKRFSLFNVTRWDAGMFQRFKVGGWEREGYQGPRPEFKPPPTCCHVVPVLWVGDFPPPVEMILDSLKHSGSIAAPNYMNPEGVVIFHSASNHLYKKTYIGDEGGKADGY